MSTAPSVPGYEVEQSLFYLSPTRRMGEHKDLVPLYSCAGVVFDKVCTACDASIPYAGVLGFMSAVEIPGVTLPLHHLRSSSNAHRYEAGAGPFNWPWTDLGVVGHVFRQPVGLSSTTRRFTSAGGAGSVRAETQGWWQAQSSQDWIEVPFANHLNTDNASFSVAPNPGGRTRLGFIGVNNASLSVLQSGTVGSFNDVTSAHLFYDWINLIGDSQIMRGCGSSNFCSEQLVKRDEMAEYIIRAMFGESFTWNAAPYFTDVPSTHPRFKYVQKMRELGITSGCTTTTYCPTDNVLRGQMAVFVTRALFGNDFVAPAITPFDDVPPTHLFFKWVQKFRELGITSGCTATSYCVDDNVTNGQMAVFLSRAFLRAP